ncbi:hypothetical protein DL96DRAFT_1552790 [Flagelloscypha sp. PMI_526]|nr:hypothetical protein DL96DRAFT_1552790 [Flagelloscypha sp. PMI_526]
MLSLLYSHLTSCLLSASASLLEKWLHRTKYSPQPQQTVTGHEGPRLSLNLATSVEDAEMQLHAIQHKLGELLGLVREYEAAEKRCISFIAKQKSYRAPIHTLPSEVLVEIFELVCLSDPHLSREDLYDFDEDGTVTDAQRLSQVNAVWRSVVLQSPSLWSHFSLFLQGRVSKLYAERLLMRLDRGQRFPLTITLDIEVDVPDVHASRVLHILAGHARRWESVDLILPERIIASAPFPISCPQLETFSIMALGSNSTRTLPVFFSHAPRLVSFRIDHLKPQISYFATMLPWSNLRIVEFGTSEENGMENSHFFHILTSCPLLQAFDADGQFHASNSEPPLTHNRLEILRMASFDANVLSLLTLPNLRVFSMDQTWPDTTSPLVVQNFLSRSPLLTHIICDDCNMQIWQILPPNMSAPIQEIIVEIREASFPLFVEGVVRLSEHLQHRRPPHLKSLRFKLDFERTELLEPRQTELLASNLVVGLQSLETVAVGNLRCLVQVNEEDADIMVLDALRSLERVQRKMITAQASPAPNEHHPYDIAIAPKFGHLGGLSCYRLSPSIFSEDAIDVWTFLDSSTDPVIRLRLWLVSTMLSAPPTPSCATGRIVIVIPMQST